MIALGLVAVALLWGATNPFIARASKGGAPGLHLLLDWRYVLPLALNLSGSVVFYYTLAHADVSVVAPVANSLTFVCTALTGRLLGEDMGSIETWLGMALVVVGVAVSMS
eukprot:Unigene13835_Nuclearia_a/m.41809 Unigene13835_Nuclearia_a/g.41809  ORF Unigene13835_Nuclearia_a/g.41809 Unigene13835_Nuclearia_a/m.41809 type:complete len:110 (+) Unigene13835_Nuclearia_a:63-392(+)